MKIFLHIFALVLLFTTQVLPAQAVILFEDDSFEQVISPGIILDSDNAGAGVNIDIRAEQGTDLDGTLRYNATLDRWELSNNGGAFVPINTGNADTIDTLDSLQFLRSDATDNYTSGILTFDAGTTLDIDANTVNLDEITNNTLILDSDNTGGNVVLQFGNTLNERIIWDATQLYFSISDSLVVGGNLRANGNAFTLDFDNVGVGANVDIIAEQGTDLDGTLRYNATLDRWELSNNGGAFNAIATSAANDFEAVYGNDVDKVLTTTNGAFTINTGTNDFVVDSADWNVTATGALDAASISSNGVVTLGNNTSTIAVDTTSWDVTTAGVASGLTGLTSTGGVNFSGSSSFRIHEAAADPAACTVGQQYFNTTTNTVKSCTSANTWTSSTTGTQYVFAYDTTTQAVVTTNTFQDITFNTNGQLNGWTHTASSANFTAATTGLYLVTVTGMVTSSATASGEIRALFNGVEVAGSQSGVNIAAANASTFNLVSTFILSATTGQILKFQLAGTATAIQLAPEGSTAAGTTRTSIKVAIVRLN